MKLQQASFLLLFISFSKTAFSTPSSNFRWASTGGGWRSMAADMGFANLFQQAGLITADDTTFSAISVNSGASWFGTQFFYSQEFNSRTSGEPEELYDFVIEWMDAYLNRTLEVTANTTNDLCDEFPDFPLFDTLKDFCEVFVAYNGDWAAFITDMLNATSTSYGDVDFASRMAGSNNRINAMQDIDLLIQTTLVPESRVRSSETNVLLGPNDLSFEKYAVVLPAVYAVDSTSTGFTIGGETPFKTYSTPADSSFSFSDYEDYYLYPGTSGSIYTDVKSTGLRGGSSRNTDASSTGTFREPFGGTTPTTSQVASISSAAVGGYSGLVPSTFAQVASVYRDQIESSNLGTLKKRAALSKYEDAINRVYQTPLFDDIAVCTQWPEPCGQMDGRFVDGGLSDNPSFAMNIAQYQKEGGDHDHTLKVVLTNTNHASLDTSAYEQSMLLSYYNTTFNQGVEPGEYIWAPGQSTPWASSQIFEDELDSDTLLGMMEPVGGTNFTTALLKGTTLDNPVFGVKGGQKVEILLININNDIPNPVVGASAIEKYTVPLADLALEIASNNALLSQIQDFFGV